MLTPQFVLNLSAKLVIVLFAGSGGSCTGIEQAIGRHVDIAVNHNPDAISCHAKNHPQTEHHREDVRYISPRDLVRARHVGYFHASPDCTDHSQAKGGQPRDTEIRSLSWVVVRWGGQVAPDVITLENVEQIRKWGPLIAKRDKATGRVVKIDGTVAGPGEYVPRRLQHLVPDPERIGKTWERFLQLLRQQGYVIEHRLLRAADYGVPTKRVRLFMVARRDGLPIQWPEPTHAKKPSKGQKKWKTAAECIDFTIASRSIFERTKPLADATLRRVAHGMKKFVLDSGDPFIVPIANWSRESVDSIREPVRTLTVWPRGGSLSIVTPVLVQTGYGERVGQAPRALNILEPLGTAVAGGVKHALVSAFLEQANGFGNVLPAHGVDEPVSTIMTKGANQRLVTAHLAPAAGAECETRVADYNLAPEAEAGALRCSAFLIRYYGAGGQWGDLREPMHTITTKDRLALVTVWLKGEPWVIVDICLRMLTPRELATASGFPRQYVIDRGHDGRMFTKTQQVAMIGNAVPPGLQRAVTAANYSDRFHEPERAAA